MPGTLPRRCRVGGYILSLLPHPSRWTRSRLLSHSEAHWRGAPRSGLRAAAPSVCEISSAAVAAATVKARIASHPHYTPRGALCPFIRAPSPFSGLVARSALDLQGPLKNASAQHFRCIRTCVSQRRLPGRPTVALSAGGDKPGPWPSLQFGWGPTVRVHFYLEQQSPLLFPLTRGLVSSVVLQV